MRPSSSSSRAAKSSTSARAARPSSAAAAASRARSLQLMRVVAAIAGLILIALMLAEFFVTFMLPRRVRRDPRIARGLNRLLWRPWRAFARRLSPSSADTVLGFFGPLFSSGLFLNAEAVSGSTVVHVIALVEAAIAIGVLFIVIGYLPAVYGSFSRREIAVSQLATRAGAPPAAGAILCRAAKREQWRELERDLRSWEEWAAELMETHLSYPILGYYRSQHVNQNWLAALTAMVDVCAFVTAVEADGENEAAEITFAIGRHALADLSLQYRVKYGEAERLSDADFDRLYSAGEEDKEQLMRLPGIRVGGDGRDLVGQPARRKVRQRHGLEDRA